MQDERELDVVRILLVEDDEDDYILTRDLLSDIPGRTFEIVWLPSYEEALNEISCGETSYDVCLVDYRLGAFTGLDVLRAAREKDFCAPIILLTGQGDVEVDIEAMNAGAADYLVKGQIDTAALDRALRYSIAQRRSQQQQLQLIRVQAERENAEVANRAKDEVLAIVSHELRAPLNAILGWSRILQTKKLDEQTMAHAIDTIERSARAQSKLIDDLLDTARVTSGTLHVEVRPIDLEKVVRMAVDVMRPAAEAKTIEVETNVQTDNDIVLGDHERLQQVIWNLLSNAIKFTPTGGRVEVRLERIDPYVQIVVSDTGIGIKPEYVPMVFDRFFTQSAGPSKRRHGGLGLGLSLAKHIVELHGGVIEVESAGEGKGATFTVRLPLPAVRTNDQSTDAKPVRSKQSPPQTLRGVHVLVVDDQSEARELLATLLEQYGARVTVAESAREALATIEAFEVGRLPDLIVSDIGMPDEDGFEFIRLVRALPSDRGGSIPAVALTAFSQPGDRIRAISAGFQMHMSKPVEPEELSVVIASLTRRTETGVEL